MLKIEMSTGNAAYRDENEELYSEAVAQSLEQIVEAIRNGHTYGSIIDINGNKVGTWSLD